MYPGTRRVPSHFADCSQLQGVDYGFWTRFVPFGHFELPFVGMPMLWDSIGVIALGIMLGADAALLQQGIIPYLGNYVARSHDMGALRALLNLLVLDIPDTYRLAYTGWRFALAFGCTYILLGLMIYLGISIPAKQILRMNPADTLHYE